MTPADELAAAVATLRKMTDSAITPFRSEPEPGHATNYMIATCGADHIDADRYGCCANCSFIGGYDEELATVTAALLRAREPLTVWLETVAAAWPRHDPHTTTATASRERQQALAVARQINRSTP